MSDASEWAIDAEDAYMQARDESMTDRQRLADSIDTIIIDWVDTFGLADSEYPLSDQQWIALYTRRTKAVYPKRCNHYRSGYGICMRSLQRSGFAHPGAHSYVRIPPNPTTQRKVTDMARTSKDIASELRMLEAEEERIFQRKLLLQEQAERIASRPAEPVGDLLQFKVQFDPDGTVYKFGAIYTTKGWFTTSARFAGPYSWHGLLDLIERDVSVKSGSAKPEVFVADSLKRVSW